MNSTFVCVTSIRASYAKALERLADPSKLQSVSPHEPYVWMLGREIQFQAETLFRAESTDLLLAIVAKLLRSETVRREVINKLMAGGAPSFERIATVVESLLSAAKGLLSIYASQTAT